MWVAKRKKHVERETYTFHTNPRSREFRRQPGAKREILGLGWSAHGVGFVPNTCFRLGLRNGESQPENLACVRTAGRRGIRSQLAASTFAPRCIVMALTRRSPVVDHLDLPLRSVSAPRPGYGQASVDCGLRNRWTDECKAECHAHRLVTAALAFRDVFRVLTSPDVS